MITFAPAALANCMACTETPPVPRQSTVSPAFTRFPSTISALHAVTPAQGSVAASSNERPAGIATTPSSCSATYSAIMPSSGTPSAGASFVRGPSTHTWKKVPATRSPVLNLVTPGPTRDHLARAIRKRNRVPIHRAAHVAADHNHMVAIVQRYRAHANQYLDATPAVGSGRSARRKPSRLVDALLNFVNFHLWLFLVSLPRMWGTSWLFSLQTYSISSPLVITECPCIDKWLRICSRIFNRHVVIQMAGIGPAITLDHMQLLGVRDARRNQTRTCR